MFVFFFFYFVTQRAEEYNILPASIGTCDVIALACGKRRLRSLSV